MRVSNEGIQPDGGMAELLRLQAEFQTVLAAETMRYLTRLQDSARAAGGTVVRPAADAAVEATSLPGATALLPVEVENCQQLHSTVTPSLSVLASPSGTTWFPRCTADPPSALVPPGQVVSFAVSVDVPDELPPDAYRGVLVLHGFRDDGIPVTIEVGPPTKDDTAGGAPARTDAQTIMPPEREPGPTPPHAGDDGDTGG